MKEPGNVCLCVYEHRFIDEHAVVGSDKKLVEYKAKLLTKNCLNLFSV